MVLFLVVFGWAAGFVPQRRERGLLNRDVSFIVHSSRSPKESRYRASLLLGALLLLQS